MTSGPRSKPGWELVAVGSILALYVAANGAIMLARPAMERTAVASVDSVLTRDRSSLGRGLQEWRDGMLDDGRWLATLVGLVLDSRSASTDADLSPSDMTRLRTLILTQIPSARVWVFDQRGAVRAAVGPDPPTARHQWLAHMSHAHDSTLLAAIQVRDRDLRVAVASPVHTTAGRGLVAVLDVSATAPLRQRIPDLAWEGHAGRAALTFPMDKGFVGTTWTSGASDPQIGWPATGWSLVDSSLIVVGGELADTTARFELAIPRAAARARAETRAAWLHASAAIVALPLCLGVLLAGRSGRNARLRAAERSLAESHLRAARAETAATRAGLSAIQARLNPHFLSNALHSVAALIATDPEAAEDAIDRLGDLFRYSLEQSERHLVGLEDEWRFVKDYLAIEQMRLGRRLAIEMQLDPQAAGWEIPPFALQPLVENAIRHGIGPRRTGGTVRVTGRRIDDRLELVVADDGMGADPSVIQASTGTGLRTLRQRLVLYTACEGRIDIETAPNAGFQVRVTLAANGVRRAAVPTAQES